MAQIVEANQSSAAALAKVLPASGAAPAPGPASKGVLSRLKSGVAAAAPALAADVQAQMHEQQQRQALLNAHSQNVERLTRKLLHEQSQLVLHSPSLPFQLSRLQEKRFTLLMSSKLEFEEWRDLVRSQQLQMCTRSFFYSPSALFSSFTTFAL